MSQAHHRKKRKPAPSCGFDILAVDAAKTTTSILGGILTKAVSRTVQPRPLPYQPPRLLPNHRLTAGQRITIEASRMIDIRLKLPTPAKYAARLRKGGMESTQQTREIEKSGLTSQAIKVAAQRRGLPNRTIIDLTNPHEILIPSAADETDAFVSEDEDEPPRPAKAARKHAPTSTLVAVSVNSTVFAPPSEIEKLSNQLRAAPSASQLENLGKDPPKRRTLSRCTNNDVFEKAAKATRPRKPPSKRGKRVRPPTSGTGRRPRPVEKPAHQSKPVPSVASEPINVDSDDDDVTIVESMFSDEPKSVPVDEVMMAASECERAPPRAQNCGPDRAKDLRFRELCEWERDAVAGVTRGVRRNQELMYVKAAGITLRGQDLACLRGSRWLNDEIMNAFAGLINARNAAATGACAELVEVGTGAGGAGRGPMSGGEHGYERLFKQARPRTHVFNTFFFARLAQHGYDYGGVRRWLRRARKDVCQLDLVLFPINLGNLHWVLAAADVRNQQFLYLDSFLGGDECGAMPMLRQWLHDEVSDKHGEATAGAMGILEWPLYENPEYTARQADGGSCGIFTLYAADFLERGVRPNFAQKDVPLLRRRTVLFLRDGRLPE